MPKAASTDFKLRACNDSSRPDWQWFRDVLLSFGERNELTPSQKAHFDAIAVQATPLLEVPSDPLEARNRLRQLLQLTFETMPHRLLYASVMGTRKGAASGAIKAFVESIKARGVEMQATLSSGFPSERENQAEGFSSSGSDSGRRGWLTAAGYLIRNLALMDGTGDESGKTISHLPVYRDLGTSTNEPINAWLPEKCGVVPYLRARVGHILSAYYERINIEDRTSGVSLDALKDNFDVELSEQKRFVRDQYSAPDNPDDMESLDIDNPLKGETMATDPGLKALEDALASSALGRKDAMSLDVAKEEEKEKVRQKVDDEIATLKKNPESEHDWPLRLFDPGYAEITQSGTTPAIDEMRAAAKNLMRRLLHRDETLTADYPAIIDALKDWDGSIPLNSFVGEIEYYATKYRYGLAGVTALPTPDEGRQAELIFAAELETPKIAADQFFPEVPGPGNPSIVHTQFAEKSIGLCQLLTEELDGISLNDPDRSDYLFLCQALNEQPIPGLEQADLCSEMVRLRGKWCYSIEDYGIEDNRIRAQELGLRLRRWNPKEEHLSAAFNRALYEMTEIEIRNPSRSTEQEQSLHLIPGL